MTDFKRAADTLFKRVEQELIMAFQSPLLGIPNKPVIQDIKPVGWSRVSFIFNGVPMCVTHKQALAMTVQNDYMNYLLVLKDLVLKDA